MWLTADPIKELWFDSDWFLHDKDDVHRHTKKNAAKRYELWHWIPPQRDNHQEHCHHQHKARQQQPYL